MHTSNITEIEDKIKLLKCYKFDTPKTLILVSSVQVWGATKQRIGEKTAEELGEAEDDTDKFKVIEYEETEYMKRKPNEEFKSWKGCETLAMSVGNNKPDLETYVLAAGIIYGNGEKTLNYLFKSAWLEDPEELPIIDEGTNHVPTIHAQDLARAVKHIIQVKPPYNYLFAVDSSPSQQQSDIIKAISSGVGTGKVKNVSFVDYKNAEWANALKLNIKVRPSPFFLPPVEEEKEEEEEVEEEVEEGEEPKPKKPKPIRMEWHCLGGLIKDIKKINVEFNSAQDLKPITVFITGPPGSGKTYLGSQIAKYYNIPLINAKYVSEKIVGVQDPLGESIRTKLTELRDEMLEEAENNKKEGEEINPDSIKPRIPNDLMCKAFRWALSQNPCRNRGYVLDGFPKNYDDLWNVFKIMPPKNSEEEEEEEPDRAKMITDMAIFPQSVIELYGEDKELIDKVKELPEDIVCGSHYNLKDMVRRLKVYRESNNDPSGKLNVIDFFNENSVEPLSLHCGDGKNFESSKIYMERFGKPFNYQVSELEEEKKRVEKIEADWKLKVEKNKELKKKNKELEIDQRIMKKEDVRKKTSTTQQKEIDLLEKEADHVKGYMLENVYEILAVGLTKVCIKKRDDPIDYLARYLFKSSEGIPHPDPYLY